MIRRRHAFQPDQLEAAVARGKAEADKTPDQLRHFRSYLLKEDEGSLGTMCV